MNSLDESELHLFIVWEKARGVEDKILEDIASKFKIIKKFEVTWSKKMFSQNLSRFYGTKLPDGSSKEKHCGTGPFLLIVVQDLKPEYKQHETSKGAAHVNTNLFSSKTLHREWSGGGHRVHATNSMRETDHDLMLLTGLSVSEFWDKYGKKPSTKVEKVKDDIIGSNGWTSLEEYFRVLNACEPYVVLRNYSMLPKKYYAEKHGDIDLLVTSLEETIFISNSKPVFKEPYRVHHKVRIGGEDVLFDFRYIGDSYYDQAWEESIQDTREVVRGFYVPNQENHFFSLLYHALIHKPEVADDYIVQLTKMCDSSSALPNQSVLKSTNKSLRALGNFMLHRGYNLTIPVDLSVYVKHENVDYLKMYLTLRKVFLPKYYLRKLKSFL